MNLDKRAISALLLIATGFSGWGWVLPLRLDNYVGIAFSRPESITLNEI